eukprot:88249-Hanusia_phi.AAC.1
MDSCRYIACQALKETRDQDRCPKGKIIRAVLPAQLYTVIHNCVRVNRQGLPQCRKLPAASSLDHAVRPREPCHSESLANESSYNEIWARLSSNGHWPPLNRCTPTGMLIIAGIKRDFSTTNTTL